ncbi:MAG: crossover junction endodeoxyribonuclease RuvC [Chitinophagaceae bacterium]|nr:crossover junction endodeoxyribonuclease RuvC [Chitinophagaceae bacterium]MBK9569597.1 crossover junction endodeoxyribonuclease RuvC [Chitinophagaceae bacterium]MBL0132274.1 crossover junction endodeoxyribonuclease RuvC [Chitinophagaceae bacterium]MBL0271702.1 crossover junction endodeoxyribonuclease RuvC [Chitinophagaceae bacterium]
MQKPSKIILGIDPGTIVMGYGLIIVKDKQVSLLELGVLKPGKIKDGYKKLQLIFNTVSGLITKYQPTDFAIEAPFFGKNVQSMLKLGRAQGVAIAAAMRHGLEVTEYSPKKVKQSVTGNGNASKEQVMKMLQALLSFKENPKQYDATDALAVAMCHHFQSNSIVGKTVKGLKSWDDFIKNNPGRIARK